MQIILNFLGPIVTFRNENGKLEIIDGQQRLTTIMLLLRAFYSKFENMQDINSKSTRELIAKCIWKTDEFDQLRINELKIDSEVISDERKDELISILKTGIVEDKFKSQYAKNFRFFQEKINEFINDYASYCAYFPARIMKNCIFLPIEAENQEVALRIFSTLNDRGMPLDDSDIFKAQLYKYYNDKNQKKEFINRWKKLESDGWEINELFTRYMYYLRALQGNKNTTTEALRKFYEKDKYAILKRDETMNDIESLADFWNSVYEQDETVFNEKVQKQLYILSESPNTMWVYFVSVYFLKNRNSNNKLDNEKLYCFLKKTIGFILAYSLIHPGVNALRTPIYPEMINIVKGKEVTFSDNKFDADLLRTIISTYSFVNQRPITKSFLTWWAFTNQNQEIIDYDENMEIEHIYSRKRNDNESALNDKNNLESLGNKAMLEKRINIRASDYRFEDKKKYYKGFKTVNGKIKEPTKNMELLEMADELNDFIEQDIIDRANRMINKFIEFLGEEDLLR